MNYLNPDKINRVVVKVGSSSLTYPSGKLSLRRIDALAAVLADLKNSGRDVVLVTSGAVAAGMARLGLSERPHGTQERQAIAAVGQCSLIHFYDKMLGEYGYTVAQMLLTKDVVDDQVLRTNAENTFAQLFSYGAIPVINENDAISTYEVETLSSFGDNDRLSAYVAILCKADLIVILSDIDGLYDADPRENDDARLIPIVRELTPELKSAAGGAGALGTGGMASKLTAAELAVNAGINMVITNGEDPRAVLDIVSGRLRGTLFTAR